MCSFLEMTGNTELAFNSRHELNFHYICNSLLVADVDADGRLEVVAGSRDGALCVYKPPQFEPWKTSLPVASPVSTIGGPFGLITALTVGDLFNRNIPILLSISADGGCSAFHCARNTGRPSDAILQPCFRQTLPSNIKGAYIGDIDDDRRCELIVALTDRVVRTYRFVACVQPSSAANKNGQPMQFSGYLIALNKWESPAQITAFSICSPSSSAEAGVTVLLSQPNDKYLLLKPKLCSENDPLDNLSDISVVYCETNQPSSPGHIQPKMPAIADPKLMDGKSKYIEC